MTPHKYEQTVFRNLKDRSDEVHRINEAEVWIKFKNGDEDAFVWIYQNYFSVLYNYARQFDLDPDFVKDHIQDLFIYIRENRSRLADISSIKFYLFKSLRRRLLANHKQKFSLLSIFGLENRSVFEIKITETPEIKLINRTLDDEKKERIGKSLNRLTARQREAVLYFYYEGLSYREIAEIMGLKRTKSARKLIYRAIDALRKELHGFKSSLY